ncbi:unnamed protein product [Ilex paraguariensis]|uniref:Uncharacterized protein n=1 Tax=Ilex paraguariensis TaxID=185542 RepID=A0ABC8SSG8_9AQUA
MGDQNYNTQALEPNGRAVGVTEHAWCQAVSCGTGITVLALQVCKAETEISLLQNALPKLQNAHPILRSKLHYNTASNAFSFTTPTKPYLQPKLFSLSSTSQLLQTLSNNSSNTSLSPLHLILEHEMNTNIWSNPSNFPCTGLDVLVSNVYALPEMKLVVVLRLHTVACDRTTAVSLLRELKELVGEREGGGVQGKKGDIISLGIEELIPNGKAKKPLWAHGVDMLSYSVNSLRLTNLKFKDVKGTRCSEVVRLKLNPQETANILAGCESRGIKLCGALAAAGLIAAHSSKRRHDHPRKKYAVVTLMDCRSLLEPPLSGHHFGYYHFAILNILAVGGGENIWDLASRSYMAFAKSKNCNKHFSDMADLNFLMCKVIENPGLTPSSSLRTSFISVFENPVIDTTREMDQELGLEDYMGCSSVHGVGPSIALFDTIRDGRLDCACVYPSPLHSREQMEEFVGHMKRVLIHGSY